MKRATRTASEKIMHSEYMSERELAECVETGLNGTSTASTHIRSSSSALQSKDCCSSKTFHWLSKSRLRLYEFHEVDLYLQDNDCILTGYRMNLSYLESYISMFHLHNEWVNVWTHFLGFVGFIGLFVYTAVVPLHPNATAMDKVIVLLVILSASYTFICSALFHLHLSVSLDACVVFGCFDYSGISALIFGGSCAVTYYMLYCDPIAQTLAVTLMLLMNSVGIVGPLFDHWRTPEFRVGRSIVYIGSGSIGLLPVFYYLIRYGTSHLPDWNTNFGIPGSISMMLQYFLGALIYTNRIPEKFWPGVFDIYGSSHNIWHILVCSATMTLYYAVLGLMEWRLDDANICLI